MDRETLEDRAIFATDGSLESDCAAFRRPDQGHRVSPWFRLPLKLHSVESARASYNTWAASERRPQPRRTALLTRWAGVRFPPFAAMPG